MSWSLLLEFEWRPTKWGEFGASQGMRSFDLTESGNLIWPGGLFFIRRAQAVAVVARREELGVVRCLPLLGGTGPPGAGIQKLRSRI